MAWNDNRFANNDIYAQRLLPSGAPLWAVNGVPVSAAAASQSSASITGDGAGGALLAWQDGRNGPSDVYAQRIERFGNLGHPEPVITSVADVSNDQGGALSVHWTPSYLDAVPANPIAEYWIWRQVPASLAEARLRESAHAAHAAGVAPTAGRTLRTAVTATAVTYWEFVGTQPARGFAGYSFTVPTLSDSTPAGSPRTLVMVEAEEGVSGFTYASAPDSGYSVDDLAPAAPAPLTGEYAGGAVTLHWEPNDEADFAEYRLYRGPSPSFRPGPAYLIATLPDTGYVDTPGSPHYYKLAAVDVHGNASDYTTLAPQGSVSVGDGATATLSLGAMAPNPMRAGGRLRFTLTRASATTLAVHDVHGRHVRTLASGVHGAGAHAVAWDARGHDGARVPSGIYFLRLQAEGRTLHGRVVVLD